MLGGGIIMKNWLKLGMVLVALNFSGQAFGWRSLDVYLDCRNNKEMYKGDRHYAYNSSNLFEPFLKKYGTDKVNNPDGIKRIGYEYNSFLFIFGSSPDTFDSKWGVATRAEGLLVIDTNIAKTVRGEYAKGLPVTFNSIHEAKIFCKRLLELCTKTKNGNNEYTDNAGNVVTQTYKYVQGNRDLAGWKGVKISVQYSPNNQAYTCDGSEDSEPG
jgi:hypothetical protein